MMRPLGIPSGRTIRALVAGMIGLLAADATQATAQVIVASPMVQEERAGPGETYRGTIVVQNTTDRPQEARVYPSDYDFSADGRTTYGEAGSGERSNADWISFTPSDLYIQANEEATVDYTVTVPASGDALEGTYWSLLIVEMIGEGSPASVTAGDEDEQVDVGLRTRFRYAIQIATHVGNPGARTVDFVQSRLTETTEGGKTLSVDVHNTGEHAYRPRLWVELYDAEGGRVARQEEQRGLLYPGTSLRQQFEFGDLEPGTYQALVAADLGGDEILGAQYTLTF